MLRIVYVFAILVALGGMLGIKSCEAGDPMEPNILRVKPTLETVFRDADRIGRIRIESSSPRAWKFEGQVRICSYDHVGILIETLKGPGGRFEFSTTAPLQESTEYLIAAKDTGATDVSEEFVQSVSQEELLQYECISHGRYTAAAFRIESDSNRLWVSVGSYGKLPQSLIESQRDGSVEWTVLKEWLDLLL